ncbi:uncharacterized protein VP01_492g9 [Puccinia sorghi]|uniref:Uncharacterized protein n=1 Tax=Puccinia sorghi TaxID=27349 RepID=A0A0L6UM24_9BASI|nr:uncharacterized protein VP01_492g9 [Puccinia sorghi]
MPSYRHLGPSSLHAASPGQLRSASKISTDQTPIPSATSFELPSVHLDHEAFMNLESFGMLALSRVNGNPLRASLEFSEEESFSDESSCTQRTSFPDCTTLFHDNHNYQQRPTSFEKTTTRILPQESAKDSKCLASAPKRVSVKEQLNAATQPFSFLSEPYKKHVSIPISNNLLKRGSSQLFQRPAKLSQKTDSFHSNQSSSSDNDATKQKEGKFQKPDHHQPRLDIAVASAPFNESTRSYSPICQSNTLSSVFEDDSDDEGVPYLKKVFPSWITKNKKTKSVAPPDPKLVKQKSRLFKANRSSISTTSS